MASKFIILLIALVIGNYSEAFLGLSSKTTINVVDSPILFGNRIVPQLCHPKEDEIVLIGKVSTVRWFRKNAVPLINTPGATGNDIHCIYLYKHPLDELVEILDARGSDACNSRHISLIEKFHKRHIEYLLIDVREGAGFTLPKPLRWFFIHYATELSDVCQQNYLDNLDLMSTSSKVDYATVFNGASGKVFETLQLLISSPENIEKDENFVLVWNTLERLYRKKNLPPQEVSVHPETGDVIRLRLKMFDVSQISGAQENCRNNLRPIYKETALSSMRLIDMGYNSKSKLVDASNESGKQFQNWYSIAQACDYLLSIRIYQDPALKPGELVVISEEEARSLDDSTINYNPVEFTKIPAEWTKDNELLSEVRADDPNKLLALIKSNVKARMKNFKRVLKKSFKQSKAKAQLDLVYYTKKSAENGKYVRKSGNSWADEATEEITDIELEKPSKSERIGNWFERSKRKHPDFWNYGVPLILLVCTYGFILFVSG